MQFEEVSRAQINWAITDRELRDNLILAIAEILLPAYRSFLKRFGYFSHLIQLLYVLFLLHYVIKLSSFSRHFSLLLCKQQSFSTCFSFKSYQINCRMMWNRLLPKDYHYLAELPVFPVGFSNK